MTNNHSQAVDTKESDGLTHPLLASLIMLLLMMLALALNLGLVWYERLTRSSPRHTLVNTMAATSAVYNSGLAVTMLVPTIIRTVFAKGGIPVILCRVGGFLVSFCVTQILLTHAENIYLLYLYTCRLGTVGVIKEELVHHLILSTNAVLGCFFGTISAAVMGHNKPAFAYCCGNFTPEFYDITPIDMTLLLADRIVNSSLIFLSIAIHVVLGWKIWTKKRSLAKVVSHRSNSNNSNHHLHSDTASSLWGDVSQVIYILIPIPVVILGNIMGDVWMLVVRYILVVTFVYVAPGLAYLRNKHIRTVLSREMMAYWGTR